MNNLQFQVVSYPEWHVVHVALQVQSITLYETNLLGNIHNVLSLIQLLR